MKTDQNKGRAMASFILGILGLVFVLVTGGPGILCGIVGFFLGIGFEDGIGRVGKLLSSLAIILGIIISIYLCSSNEVISEYAESTPLLELRSEGSDYESDYASRGTSWHERD